MNQSVDLLVVGSGFGGLTAASLAARSGLTVRLVERHTRPGGCAGDFALGGFWFPAGATVVTGLEEGGILRQVFDSLDIEVPHTPLNPSIVFHVGGHQLEYSASTERWKADLRRAFPASAAAYERFWDWTHSAGGKVYRIGASLPSLPIESFADIRRSLPALRPEVVSTLPLLFRTVASEMRRLGAEGEL
ncbi:MAG: NAD(P)-binding protein, partial [bacterium]